MSKITIECFDRSAEIVSFESDREPMLVFEFTSEYDGYIALGEATARIKGARCTLDLRKINDGEYTPHLILSDKTVDLPRLKKEFGALALTEPPLNEINSLSLRERRLNKRVTELEKQMEEISKKVYGSSLFQPLP